MNAARLGSISSLRLPRVGALTTFSPNQALSPSVRRKNEMNIAREANLKKEEDCEVVITQLYEDEKAVLNYCLQSPEGVSLNVLRPLGEHGHGTGNLKRTISSSTAPSVGEYRAEKRGSSGGITTRSLDDLLKHGSGHYDINDVKLLTKRKSKLRKQTTTLPRVKQGVLSKNYSDKSYYKFQEKTITEELLDIRDVNFNKKVKSQDTNGQSLILDGHKSEVTEGYTSGHNDSWTQNEFQGLSSTNNSSEITDLDERLSHELRDFVAKKRNLAGTSCDSEDEYDVGYLEGPIAVQLVSKGGSSQSPKILTVDPFTFEKCIRWIDGLPKKFSHMSCLSVVQE